ncbi:membrane-bound lytic murein transglycosylase MltF [Shewanella sp. 1_MG-2023]|uniref:membrane-bound lytic murein transglycosylase MltF n=1 Tax=unclassified Shewanella TaxID=196818 RepID=UPI0026E1E12F|nr:MULTISPECIES: membrane-bound lytic murein transglycosylase MltF [unclassified Shewanella]MDO6613110.1 membrane-bound lytic murein transglycosylase MltF [Shewanella sp. 7_MG-2023]MDO6772979.1 membrane-bound lytic murein transglycosylase MltF [Shewanella sp. 2_MG-2023]MDO6796246.1 membrane-bound lytic murein transglycosylase MltF [Shewanella sp. 1_MG-2023]
MTKLLKIVAIISITLLLSACHQANMKATEFIEETPQRTVLKVGTLYGSQTYLNSDQGESGFDYEMAAKFADYLDVPLEMIPYHNRQQLFEALRLKQIDIVAAAITTTKNRREQFLLGPTLYEVNQVLIYKSGNLKPRDFNKLQGDVIVISESAAVDTVIKLQQTNPNLSWQQVDDKDNEELFSMVASGEVLYTIADSNSLLINQRYLPELREGIVLDEKTEVVWLLPPLDSDRLMSALLSFWHNQKRNGTLEHLNEKYFGHVKRFDYVDTRAFIRAIDNVLPEYQALFEKHAGNLDWRKLAAAGYQESHWNPKARSPTGVRGMMMLTQPTASSVGVDNRLDAEQSIRGGAIYLQKMIDRLPASIPDSQRIWFALASYNVGLGHVEDARKITQGMGKDPSAWRDVKQVLPLLQQRKYYQHTRYGYARGSEAVHYVDNIRRYYDTLVWVDNQTKQLELELEQTEALAEETGSQTDDIDNPEELIKSAAQ